MNEMFRKQPISPKLRDFLFYKEVLVCGLHDSICCMKTFKAERENSILCFFPLLTYGTFRNVWRRLELLRTNNEA